MTHVEDIYPDWHGEEMLGTGSYGTVWRASHTVLGLTSQSAIKVLEFPQDPSEIAQLREMGMGEDKVHTYLQDMARGTLQEVAAMDALKGAPNVVSVEDCRMVTTHEGFAIGIRMELLEDLPSHFRRMGNPDPREVARLGIDICRALEVCHDQGIIHRDIKPQNVFAGRYGNYLLGDFGIARRLEGAGSTVLSQRGTRSYMAPEVFYGQRYGSSVDLYSLGLMLYRYLNGGVPPFLDTTTGDVTLGTLEAADNRRIRGEALPTPTGADPALAAIVIKACAPVPQDRYTSSRKMREALETWLAGNAEEARMPVAAAPEPTMLLSETWDSAPATTSARPAQVTATPKPEPPAKAAAPTEPKAASTPKQAAAPKQAAPAKPKAEPTRKPAATPKQTTPAKPEAASTPKPVAPAKPKRAESKPAELVEPQVFGNANWGFLALSVLLFLTPMAVAVLASRMSGSPDAWIGVYGLGTAAFLYALVKGKAGNTPAGRPRTKGKALVRLIVTYAIFLGCIARAAPSILESGAPGGMVFITPLLMYPSAFLIGLMVDSLLFNHAWERLACLAAIGVSAAFVASAYPSDTFEDVAFLLFFLVPAVWAQVRAVLYLLHKVDKLM